VVWVRSAAIRPIVPQARLDADVLGEVEAFLAEDEDQTESRLSETFKAFELAQPHLSAYIGNRLTRTHDEVAMALGYFLTLALWMAFDRAHGDDLGLIDDVALQSVEEALALDEELRGRDPTDGIESDDVVAMEQPDAIQFVQEHIDAALDVNAGEADVDQVHRVYRLVIVEVLALSYAVKSPGTTVPSHEIHA